MDPSFEPFVGESAEPSGVDATRWEVEQIVCAYIRVVIDVEEFWKVGGCVGSEWRVPIFASARISALIDAGAISQDRITQLQAMLRSENANT